VRFKVFYTQKVEAVRLLIVRSDGVLMISILCVILFIDVSLTTVSMP
jgi:hypothetical protein